jgi:hypothetical protein
MFRRTLEAVVCDRSSAAAVAKLDDSRSLAAALEVMADEGSLDRSSATGPRSSGSPAASAVTSIR